MEVEPLSREMAQDDAPCNEVFVHDDLHAIITPASIIHVDDEQRIKELQEQLLSEKPQIYNIVIVAEEGSSNGEDDDGRRTALKVLRTSTFWSILDTFSKHRGKHPWQHVFHVDGGELSHASSMHALEMDFDIIQFDVKIDPNAVQLEVVSAEDGTSHMVTAKKTTYLENVFQAYSKWHSDGSRDVRVGAERRYLTFYGNVDGKEHEHDRERELHGNSTVSHFLDCKVGPTIVASFVKPLAFASGTDYNEQDGLPVEMLSMVFGFVSWMDSRTFIKAVPLVCRRWYSVCHLAPNVNIDTTWASQRRMFHGKVVPRNPITSKAIMTLVDRHPLAHTIKLVHATNSCVEATSFDSIRLVKSELSTQGFQYMLAACARLKHLDLTGCHLFQSKWLSLMSTLAQLEVLKMRKCKVLTADFIDFLATAASVKHIVLPQLISIDHHGNLADNEGYSHWFTALGKYSHSLEYLDATDAFISGHNYRTGNSVGDDRLAELVAGCPLLQVLKLPRGVTNGFEAIGDLAYLKELAMPVQSEAGTRLSKSAVLAIAAGCLELIHLEFCGCSSAFLEAGINFPSLQYLKLNFDDQALKNDSIEAIGKACQELLHLSFGRSHKFEVTCIGSAFPKLECLDVSSKGSFIGITSEFPALRKLLMSNCFGVTDESLEVMLKSASQLEYLDISQNMQCSKEWFHLVGANCPNLRTLKLNYNAGGDASGMLSIVTGCPKLEKLNMGSMKNIQAGEWLDAVRDGALPKLTQLDLDLVGTAGYIYEEQSSETRFVDNRWATSFAKGCPLLEEISFHNNPHITNDAVSALAENCPLMKRVDVSGCPKITERAIMEMGRSWPLLEVLEMCGSEQNICTWPSTFKHMAQNCKKLTKVIVSRDKQEESNTSALASEVGSLAYDRHAKIRAERHACIIDKSQLHKVCATKIQETESGTTWTAYSEHAEPEKSLQEDEDMRRDEDPQMVLSTQMNKLSQEANTLLWKTTVELFPAGVLSARCSCCRFRNMP